MALRGEVAGYRKSHYFDMIAEEIMQNENDAWYYYCPDGDADSLWESDELDDDIVNIIDDLLGL